MAYGTYLSDIWLPSYSLKRVRTEGQSLPFLVTNIKSAAKGDATEL